jgi:DNA-binding response OmpR family regulator
MDLRIGSDASPRPPATLTESDIYDDGFLRIEHDSFYVSCGGTVLYLPRKEFLLLSRLARSIDRIVRSEALWAHVWGEEDEFRAGTLRVYVSHLRRKLQPFGLNIKTLISVGYCLVSRSRA